MKKTLLIMSALLLTAVGANAQEESAAYKFVCTDWVTLDVGRVTQDKFSYDEDANTITVEASGTNNVAIGNSLTAAWDQPYEGVTTANYIVTKEQKWFTIVGTNLSTTASDSKLWWMNAANYGEWDAQKVIVLEDGQILVAWDLTETSINTNLQNEENYLTGWTGGGLTSTTGTSVISDINFYTDEELEAIIASGTEPEPEVTVPYEFVCTEWGSMDLTRLTDDKVTYDETNNTITVNVTGDNNVALGNGREAPYTTANYYVTNEQSWFIVVGTNLSTAEGASKLWWMDGANWGEWDPTKVVTLSNGQVLVAWDLSTMTEIDVNLQNEKNTLSGWTGFGLTSTIGTSVISDICFYTWAEAVTAYPEIATPYVFINTDWVVLDDHASSTSATATDNNTITITTTANSTTSIGLTNGNETPRTTADYYVTNEQCWFVVVGTNLSTAEGASELWWMNGDNDALEWDPTEVVTLSDGQVLVAWDLSTIADLDQHLQNAVNSLDGWTCFGLTSTTGTSVISDINFYTENEAHSMINGTSHFCTANESHWSTTATLKDSEHLRVDTWATQSDEIMSTPFMEYYADGDAYLSDATISHEQLTGLTPGMYTVSMDIRIIDYAKDGDSNAKIGTGTTFNANGVSEDLLTGSDGTEDEYGDNKNDEVYGTYTLNCEVGEAGTLDISLDVKDATYSWIMWKNLSVTYAGEVTKETISWEMTDAKWGTIILPFDAEVPSGLTAHSCAALEEDGTTLKLEDVETLEANTPYILSGTATTYTFSGVATNTQDTYTAGLLTGTFKEMDYSSLSALSGTVYLLQNHESENGEEGEGVAFYPVTNESTDASLGANHCYLTLSSASGVRAYIGFPDAGEETGIVAVESENLANDAIYDLSGRRVAKAVKGVYIQNGKKVLVK